MKKFCVLLVASSLGIGCASKSTPDDDSQTVEQPMNHSEETGSESESESSPSEQPKTAADSGGHKHRHKHRGHRFDEPRKYAKRWNDPARNEWQKPDEVLQTMKIEAGMTVADIGTGTGYFVPFLSKAVGEDGKVWALDIEPNMVKFVSEMATEKELGNVEAKKVSPEAPGVSGVDRFLTVNTWHHIADREGYAAKIAAALNDGGSITIVDYVPDAQMRHGPPPKMRLEPQTVITELEAGGLKAELVEESLPRQYIVVGHKQ